MIDTHILSLRCEHGTPYMSPAAHSHVHPQMYYTHTHTHTTTPHHYPFLPLGTDLAFATSTVICFLPRHVRLQWAANHQWLGWYQRWHLPQLHLDNYNHNFIEGNTNAANKESAVGGMQGERLLVDLSYLNESYILIYNQKSGLQYKDKKRMTKHFCPICSTPNLPFVISLLFRC